MKLFHDLSNLEQEHAIHHLMHLVFETYLEHGLPSDLHPETEEEKAKFEEAKKAVETAQALEEYGDQMDVLFDNDAVAEIAWQAAYDTAHTSYFTEEGENCFHIPHIEELFEGDEEDVEGTIEATEDNVVQFPGGKKPSELN